MPASNATEDIIGGTYRVISLIGEGGMGTVFAVEHIILQKQFALKMLSKGNFTPTDWQRFQNEAQSMAHLKHNNIIQVTDLGIHNNQYPYYVMELLQGKSLGQKIKARGRLSLKDALNIFRQVAEALAFVHDHGIIHRDIKPDNIMLESTNGSELVKLVDFGIAKLTQKEGQNLTATGEVFGSPLYMSPEQCTGQPVDTRSDIYSYACVFYEALTGKPPIMGENAVMTMMLKSSTKAPLLSERVSLIDFPPELEQLVESMLSTKKEDRPLSLRTVAVKLKSLQNAMEEGSLSVSPKTSTQRHGRTGEKTSAITKEGEEQSAGETDSSTLKLLLIVSAVFLLLALPTTIYFLWSKPTKQAAPPVVKSQPEGLPLGNMPSIDIDPLEHGGRGKPEQIKNFKSDELAAIKVLSATGPSADGIIVKKFFFPKDFSLGLFARYDSNYNNAKLKVTKMPAQGYLEAPLTAQTVFMPLEGFIANPANFAKFGDNELTDIECVRSGYVTVDAIKQMQHIKTIRTLKFQGSSINSDCVKLLDNFPNLQKAEIGSIDVQDEPLSKCRFIHRLRHLSVDRIAPISKTLSALAQDKDGKLKVLSISDIKLSPEDIASVSRLTSLEQLNINGANISDQQLAQLQHLKLKKIEISRCTKLSPQCYKILAKFPELKIIHATKMNWSNEDMQKFAQALRPREVEVSSEDLFEIIR
ncbi:MAG: protein kinase [Candidatus Obscuribacter sp.]|nr:protein kinase [Candidatus Obscuribacter sp.]